jgi:hypothetical protein
MDINNITMSNDEFDFDFSTSKTVFPYMKKGSGKKMSNAAEEKEKYDYLRKGEGSLASHYHGETEFSQQRSEQVVKEQFDREVQHYQTIESYMKTIKKK